VSVVDDVRQQITKRLKELKPLVDEYHELEAMVRRLADGDGARSSPAQSPTRRRSTRSTNGRSGGRPRGGGTRSTGTGSGSGQARDHHPGNGPGDEDYPQLPLPRPTRTGQARQGQKVGKGWEPASK